MSEIEKVDVLLEIYRDEILNNAKERGALFDEIDRLLIENSDLQEEVSEQHYEIQRLKNRVEDLKINKGDDTDFMMNCVPRILRKKITAENSDQGIEN